MDLSVREAAVVLGRSQRTVRDQLARGDLPGVKRDGRWWVRKDALPLTEPQRRALAAKAESLRQAVEAALPSRAATSPRSRRPCVDDSAAFRLGRALLFRLEAQIDAPRRPAPHDANSELPRLRAALRAALMQIAVSVHQFAPALKLAALNRARHLMAREAARLALDAPHDEPLEPGLPGPLQVELEAELLPAIAREARRAERLGERRQPMEGRYPGPWRER